MTKNKLSTFKIDFEIFLISKQIKKTELSNQLKMSLPTLLKRISDPEISKRLTSLKDSALM